jgi:hypothetical protein
MKTKHDVIKIQKLKYENGLWIGTSLQFTCVKFFAEIVGQRSYTYSLYVHTVHEKLDHIFLFMEC